MPGLDGAVWFGVSLVTLVGDPLVIVALGLAVYWFGDRLPGISDRLDTDRSAVFFATIVGALALSAALKTGFALERPPGAGDLPGVSEMPEFLVGIYTWIVGPGGHAFPSGHATGGTVGWLGLAWAIADEDRRPFALAGGLVVAIAASRVALGVHRPHEVLVGVAVGLAYLTVAVSVLERPRPVFALAGVIGVAGPVIVGLTGDSLLAAGFALGTAVGWEFAHEQDHQTVTRPILATLLAVVLVAGVTFVHTGTIEAVIALVGIGGGAATVAGGRVFQKIEIG